ncbi:MAG: hypothetical protein J7501_06310 [Bdellovibrio sp.]|nr:hypothetical protein [Bdellovibrio sp.]
MKRLILTAAVALFSVHAFAEEAIESSIEAEMLIGGSEEARVDAQEQQHLLDREKIRKEQIKQQALKSAQEAVQLEATAARESENTRKVKADVESQIAVLKKQIKASEERKVKAEKNIQAAKDEVARYNQIRDKYLAKQAALEKEIAQLNQNADQLRKDLRNAQGGAVKAHKDSVASQDKLRQMQKRNVSSDSQ